MFGRCRLLLQVIGFPVARQNLQTEFVTNEAYSQIHDELILEVDSKFVKEAAELVQSCMRGAASLNGKPFRKCPRMKTS